MNSLHIQINSAIGLARSRKQWVDLGNLEEACLARPGTCGKAGGAIAFWIKGTFKTPSFAPGVISSRTHSLTLHFEIYYFI